MSLIFPLILLFYKSTLTKEILKDLRIVRILHYVALAGLGMALYLRESNYLTLYLNSDSFFVFPLFIISLAYSAVFAIVTNNIEDLEADKITNPNRPLVKGTVNAQSYYRVGIFCQVFSFFIAFMAQKEMFYGILAISVGYYIYSCKPFRLKRIPFIAKLIIGCNSLAVAVCGFVLAGGNVFDFPLIWVFYILIPLSLAANFVDLKDTEGDGKTGIKTLPVLWGEPKAKLFIAGCTVSAYIMAGVLLRIPWLYPLNFLMAVLHIWFLYKKPYDEKPVFMIYVSALFGLDIFLFISITQF